MKVANKSENKGSGSVVHNIGFFEGELKWINPDAATVQEIYGLEELPEKRKYMGEDKNKKEWSMVNFVFLEKLSQKPVEYKIFMNKELATNDKDGKSWWVNQHGVCQYVDDEKNLFTSFKCIQTQNEAKEWVDVCDEAGTPMKLSYRMAYRGEVALYTLLRSLVCIDWFKANSEDSLFTDINKIMRGNVKDLTEFIGTENYRSVVGMLEIEAKDGDNGAVLYNSNCIDGAWMPGFKIGDAKTATTTNSWERNAERPKGKGSYKLMDMHNFYKAVKRCKNIYEFAPMHTFDPSKHVAAGNDTFVPAKENISDTDY